MRTSPMLAVVVLAILAPVGISAPRATVAKRCA